MSLWHVEERGTVAVLSYNHPPRNFLTFEALSELCLKLETIANDNTIRIVMVTSAVPEYFAAHADLDDVAALSRGPVPEAGAWYRAFRLLEDIPQPTIAAIDGQAWGGAIELALSCTLRVASERAHLSFPEIALGFIPGAGGSQRLARLAGAGVAADLILTGRVIDAAEALRLGLVQRVWPTAVFGDAALGLASDLAARPRAALAAAKKAVVHGSRLPLSDGLKLEGAMFAELIRQPESLARQAAARAAYRGRSSDTVIELHGLNPPSVTA